MSKYIITGDCNGLKYYMGLKDYKSGFVPDFTWYGISDNATSFHTKSMAEKIAKELENKSKLPLTIEPREID